jgi:putative alpha-1,2-mannosidase
MIVSLWDQFRSQLPLLTITDPTAVTDMVRSLIDTYRHTGWLPDCRMSLNKGYTQVKSTAVCFEDLKLTLAGRI